MPRYEVRFVGMLSTYALLDSKGQELYSLQEAADLAEEMYKDDWSEVTNGQTRLTRDEYIERECKVPV